MIRIDSKLSSMLLVFGIYLLTFLVVYFIWSYLPSNQILLKIFMADVMATIIVFGFSVIFNNSSIYDPYWSVIPPFVVVYLNGVFTDGDQLRQVFVLLLVMAWSIRLTGNWIRGWTGIKHEDWRYVAFAEKTGKWYWLVSFFGIHLMPTIFVFLGCLPLWYALSSPASINIVDGLAIIITLLAIVVETIADEQLLKFRSNSNKGSIMKSGLWAYSRHPNYLGEIGFWLGIFMFAVAANLGSVTHVLWTATGFISMILLFKFISIPLMDKRNIANKPGYNAFAKQVPALFPKIGHTKS